MSNFKVGDKVVRTVESKTFWLIQGVKNYYIVTDVGAGGYWLQLDGVRDKEDPRPWYAPNFELYQEPEDEELPPAPTGVSYIKDDARRKLEVYNTGSSVTLLLSLRKVSTSGYSLDPDAALQLAHDLRRMAMSVKRKEKAQ